VKEQFSYLQVNRKRLFLIHKNRRHKIPTAWTVSNEVRFLVAILSKTSIDFDQSFSGQSEVTSCWSVTAYFVSWKGCKCKQNPHFLVPRLADDRL
jgi:hypothetical protein